MLGFNIRAYTDDTAERPGVWLATWEAHSVRWLNELVEQGVATLVAASGYPSVWTFPAVYLDQYVVLIDAEPKLVRDTLDLKRDFRDPSRYALDISPNLLRMSRDELVNTTIRVVAWDQS